MWASGSLSHVKEWLETHRDALMTYSQWAISGVGSAVDHTGREQWSSGEVGSSSRPRYTDRLQRHECLQSHSDPLSSTRTQGTTALHSLSILHSLFIHGMFQGRDGIGQQAQVVSTPLHFAWGIAEAKSILVTAVCVFVCLSLAAFPHYCTNPNVTRGNGRGCPLVVHYWTDLQSVRMFRCYDNIAPDMKCQRVLVLALCLVWAVMIIWS